MAAVPLETRLNQIYLAAMQRLFVAEERRRQGRISYQDLEREIIRDELVRRSFRQKLREGAARIGFPPDRVEMARDAIFNVIQAHPELHRGDRVNPRRMEMFLEEYNELAGIGRRHAEANARLVVERPKDDGSKWQGYDKQDVEVFNAVFDRPSDISICPVCFSWGERKDGCMYMKHECLRERRHHDLYVRFNINGKIEWCTLCGRITNGMHQHYELSVPSDPAMPPPAEAKPTVDGAPRFFDTDCKNSGGGGHEEKIQRFDGLIRKACELQEQVGKLGAQAAFEQIVEAAWVSPMAPSAERTADILSRKKFDIPCELPERAAETTRPDAPKLPDVPRPADESELVPIKHKAPDNVCFVEGEPHSDGRPVYQFQHKQPNGSILKHDEYICAKHLETLIRSNMMDGKCYINPARCRGKLYPEEIQGIVNDNLYNVYRHNFNRYNKVGGGRGGNIFRPVNMDEVTCTPPPKKAGRRKTYRKKNYRKHTSKK